MPFRLIWASNDLDHPSRPTSADFPGDPLKQVAWRDAEAAGQLDQGVDPRQALAPLDRGHLGPVDLGVVGQRLLTHVESAAGPPDPRADYRGDLLCGGLHQPRRDSNA